MRNRILTITSLVLCLFLTTGIWTSAQSGSFHFTNDTNIEIDRDAVEAAAQPLINRHDASVAVYAVVSGSTTDLTQRLEDDDLATLFGTRDDTIAIYFATEERYSEIRWGDNFDNMLGNNIRSETLNPMLREGQFTQGIVNTLDAIDSRLSNPWIGIGRLLNSLCSSPVFWIIAGFAVYTYIAFKMGWTSNSGDDQGSSWRRRTNRGSGGWGGGSSGGGNSGGGGSDGGGWDS